MWSFGCVLYKIWSLGHKPFEEIPVRDVCKKVDYYKTFDWSSINDFLQLLTKVNSGYRLPPPPGCPKLLYKLMIRCWSVWLYYACCLGIYFMAILWNFILHCLLWYNSIIIVNNADIKPSSLKRLAIELYVSSKCVISQMYITICLPYCCIM